MRILHTEPQKSGSNVQASELLEKIFYYCHVCNVYRPAVTSSGRKNFTENFLSFDIKIMS